MNTCAKRTIKDLPDEILIHIFQYVYLATQSLEVDSEASEGLAEPSLFPANITDVCKKWKELVRSIPHFVTRVIFFVDEPISVDKLLELTLSKTLPIKVFIIRREYSAAEDVLERRRVVVFDVLHDTSLPRITYFSGKADKLRTLRMKSRLHGAVIPHMSQPTPSLRTNPKAFLCPRLQYLDLDGRVFIMALSIQGWAESIHMLSQKQLTISNIPPQEDFNVNDLLSALSQLGHLTLLKLCNIDLDVPSNVGRSFISIFIQNLELEGLKRDFLSGFFDHHYNKIEVSSLILYNCELGHIDHLASWHLTLRDIPQEEDITAFVKKWDGFGLHIENCSGVDDSLILALSDFRPSRDQFFANTLRQLEIVSSGSVSIKAIKGLVFVRLLESSNHDPEEVSGVCQPLHLISVIDTDVAISESDKNWLKSKVDAFYWYQRPPAVCMSPTVQDDLVDFDFSIINEDELELIGLSSLPGTGRPPTDPQQTQVVTAPSSPPLTRDYSLIEWSEEDLEMIDRY